MEFESLLRTGNHPPLVFQESINNWPAIQWTVAHLAALLPDKQFQCKISPVDHEGKLENINMDSASNTVKTLYNNTLYNSKILYNVKSICINVLVITKVSLKAL